MANMTETGIRPRGP